MFDIVEFIKSQSMVVIIIIGLILITIHTVFAVLIGKLNEAKYGKTTTLAWIPGINVFLLGKLAVHWTFGIILFLGLIFDIIFSFRIKGTESIYSILQQNDVLIYQASYTLVLLIILIMGKIRLNQIIKNGLAKDNFSSFVAKDFEKAKEEAKIVVDNKSVVEEQIKDDFQYNSYANSLNELSKNESDKKENPK